MTPEIEAAIERLVSLALVPIHRSAAPLEKAAGVRLVVAMGRRAQKP